MNCEICFESFEKINSFNQHMSYVHHTNHLEEQADNYVIAEEFRRDTIKFQASDYCKVCGIQSEYTVCVVNGNRCKYAGTCEIHQGVVREFLRS
jgi:hypothetical protein